MNCMQQKGIKPNIKKGENVVARRGKYVRLIAVVLLLALGTLALAGCQREAEDPDAGKDSKYGGTAVFRIHSEVNYMNPFSGGIYSLYGISEGLVREQRDVAGKYVGVLAEDWDISPDGCTYTFKLREGVKWHDGEPFTADDVIFSYNLVMNEEAGISHRAYMYIDGEPIVYEKVNDYEVKMILPKKYAPALNYLVPIVPKHYVEDLPPAKIKEYEWERDPIFTGPFKFVEYKTGEYVRLERFEDYWGGRPYLDEIILRIIPDNNTAAVALESGEIDFTDAPPDVFKRLENAGTFQAFQGASGIVHFICMNNKAFPFDDVRVRQAISHLVNREAICEQVHSGYAKPAYGFMVPTDMFYNDDANVKHEYDVEKAKQLLADAGFEPGPDGILVKDGKKFEFDLLYRHGDVQREQAALIVQSDLAKVGITMNPRGLEWSAIVRELNANTDPLPFDAILLANGLGPDPDRYSAIYASWSYPSGGPGSNYCAFLNPEVDELFERGQTEMDSEKRQEIYNELQTIISDQCPSAFMWYPQTMYCYSQRLKVDEAEMSSLNWVRFWNPAWLYVTDGK